MELKKLLSLDPVTIRHDENLLRIFVDYFELAFGYVPNCAGCVFKKIHKQLHDRVFKQNIHYKNRTIMTNHVVKPRNRSKIFTFINEKGKAKRSYGKNMTEDFAIDFLKYGTKAEIEERKLLFESIPAQKIESDVVNEGVIEESKEETTKNDPTPSPKKDKPVKSTKKRPMKRTKK